MSSRFSPPALRLTPMMLTLSLVLAACGGPSPAVTAEVARSPGTPLTPSTPVADVEGLFGENLTPSPYGNMVPLDPSQLRAPLPDVPESTGVTPQTTVPVRTVRVYYSDPLPASSPYRDGGSFHALMLRNLLGHRPFAPLVHKTGYASFANRTNRDILPYIQGGE